MTPEEIDRIEADHGASIVWQNGEVGWECKCGGAWPCGLIARADDARRAQARLTQAAIPGLDEVSPGEFWR